MSKIRVATAWLSGCAGCHMSFLDMDEFIVDLVGKVDIVFSPIADAKEFPRGVDVAIVEGAVANTENLHWLLQIRERSQVLIALGDCAVAGNVPALRNQAGTVPEVLKHGYETLAPEGSPMPDTTDGILPELLPRVMPLHEAVKVDVFIPGCPPPAPRIRAVLEALLAGKAPAMKGPEMLRFG